MSVCWGSEGHGKSLVQCLSSNSPGSLKCKGGVYVNIKRAKATGSSLRVVKIFNINPGGRVRQTFCD